MFIYLYVFYGAPSSENFLCRFCRIQKKCKCESPSVSSAMCVVPSLVWFHLQRRWGWCQKYSLVGAGHPESVVAHAEVMCVLVLQLHLWRCSMGKPRVALVTLCESHGMAHLWLTVCVDKPRWALRRSHAACSLRWVGQSWLLVRPHACTVALLFDFGNHSSYRFITVHAGLHFDTIQNVLTGEVRPDLESSLDVVGQRRLAVGVYIRQQKLCHEAAGIRWRWRVDLGHWVCGGGHRQIVHVSGFLHSIVASHSEPKMIRTCSVGQNKLQIQIFIEIFIICCSAEVVHVWNVSCAAEIHGPVQFILPPLQWNGLINLTFIVSYIFEVHQK